ncbi:unnamed protein product [Closterium sp. NIES-54]
MLALCREQRLEHRTKHIALRYFLARELQQRGQLRLAYVASEANTADVFTKALAPCDHQRCCTQLGFPICTQFVHSHSSSFTSSHPVLTHFSTVLPCSVAPSGTLSGLYLPSFSTNLVSGADLQDGGIHQFTPASQRVTHCTCARTGRHLATFTRQPGSSLYTLTTESPPIAESAQVAASGQVFAVASRSGPESAPCSCRLLSHQNFLWHHRLGHPSPPRLRGMASPVLLVSNSERVSARTFLFCICTLTEAESSPLTFYEPSVVHEASARCSRFQTLHSKMGLLSAALAWSWTSLVRPWSMRLPPIFCGRLRFQYTAHQINLQPRVSLPETSPALLWTGKVGDASAFRVWGSRAFGHDLSADKLSLRAVPCVFLGFPPDAPGWQFYHPTSRRVLSSQDVTFDESVPYYRLFPYRTASLPPPRRSSLRQVDAVDPVEVAVDSGAARGAEPAGAGSWGAEPRGADSGGAEPGGATPGGAASRGAEPGGAASGGAESEGTGLARGVSGGAGSGGSSGASSRRELLSTQELREWFARRWRRAAVAGGAAGAGGSAAAGGVGAAGPGGASSGSTGVAGPAGASRTGAGGAAGVVATEGAGAGPAASSGGPAGAGAAGGVGAEGASGAGASEGTGVGAAGAGGAACAGAVVRGAGAVPSGAGGAERPRPYFVPLLEQVLGLPPSASLAPPLACPPPIQSESQLQPSSPLPAPSPYTGPTGGLAERCEPASRPASPDHAARTSSRGSRQHPPPVPGTHRMSLRPSTAPLRAPLPSPPESSLPVLADPESDSLRAASPAVTRLLATVVTDPSFESAATSALVSELVDFAARCRLDYAASLVAESESVCPPSVEGECALGTDVLEDRQEQFQCFAAASPHLVSMLLAREGDPDAPDIPTPRSYAEAIEGPYSSQWQAAMDADMASWKSTGTYDVEVPPPGVNIVSGMWIFRVKRPPGSPPVFKARYVARGFSQRQGVDYFQTFSPTPKMTTLRVLLHIAAHRDYELHSLDFNTAFLQGSLHEEIWLRRPPGFTGSFPPGTQWSLRRPVYGLRQAPREWHDTLRTTLAALGFAPSTADPPPSLPNFHQLRNGD